MTCDNVPFSTVQYQYNYTPHTDLINSDRQIMSRISTRDTLATHGLKQFAAKMDSISQAIVLAALTSRSFLLVTIRNDNQGDDFDQTMRRDGSFHATLDKDVTFS